jgi:aminoglycoside phosphotransferase family enzyme/predicted kinase
MTRRRGLWLEWTSPRIAPAMDDLVRALLDPAAYDHPVARVELLETHISWVFLTGHYAYKVKKPVQFGFVDFSTAERRRHCCEEELRLNRRLAPDLYLDLAVIRGPVQRASLHGSGPPIETAVRMRQFQQRDLLPQALARGAVSEALLDQLARDLAVFHTAAAVMPPDGPWGTAERVLEPALANFESLRACGRLPADQAGLIAWTRAEHGRLRPLLQRRHSLGHIRECHGDLHLGNMALHGGRITVFDGIEFSEALRWIDPLSDLAFLLMDLRQRGQPAMARRLLQGWLEWGGDYGGLPLLPWYGAYRALVRAKVAALRLEQQGPAAGSGPLLAELDAYLAAARQAMAPRRGALLITHGVSGSGKSHAAAILRGRGWLQLRSDLERRRLFGRWGCGPSTPLQGDPYAPAVGEHLYSTVLAGAAAAALAAGLAVVVDATFLRRDQRDRYRALAHEAGAGFGILAPAVSVAEARRRIAIRQQAGGDPSEADAAVLERQLQAIQGLAPEEQPWLLSGVDDPRLLALGRDLPSAT